MIKVKNKIQDETKYNFTVLILFYVYLSMIIIVFVVPLQADICHYKPPTPPCTHIPTVVVVSADAVMGDRLCC